MKVSELAEEFKTTIDHVLDKLRSLKLKAKDGDQELSKAVLIVLKSELIKDMKEDSRKKASAAAKKRVIVPKKEAVEPETVPEEEETPKAGRKRKTKKEAEPAEVKPIVEEPVKEKEPKVSQPEKPAELPQPVVVHVPVTPKAGEQHPKVQPPVVPKVQAPLPEKEDRTKAKKHKKPLRENEPYTGDLDFKVGDEALRIKKRKIEKAKHIKQKLSDQPFISLKPFNKKKRRPMGEEGGETRQPGVAQAEIPHAVAGGELKPLELRVPITVKDFANSINEKAGVVLQILIQMKIFANINQNLDEDVVIELARKFGYQYVQVKSQEQQLVDIHEEEEDDPSKLTPRAPVVTFMGHVDHGKTSLLDRIRNTKIVEQEHGRITQHIGAYSVEMKKGRITFLDTPGHEAFTAMRARGAHITDIVVLVVAADEGIMPQTQEAIAHAQAAGVPMVVALNKIDLRDADPDRVKKQLADQGLTPEDWGGKVIVAPVSAASGQGINELLELILLEAEMLELRANKDKQASGIVVEAHLDPGRGSVSSIIVQSGTLRLNDYIVSGPTYGKVRAMFSDRGKHLEEAGPSMPVEILGLDGVPEAGSKFYVVKDERTAKEITEKRRMNLKDQRLSSSKRITLEDLYSQIQAGVVKELNVILKADVQGSLEALRDSLAKIPSEEVKVRFIHLGVGEVNPSDVILAVASNAIIIAFHVGISPRAAQELEKQQVDVRQYRIIYDAVDDVKKSLSGLLAPKIKRTFLGRVEVRQVFQLSKAGIVAGCFVVKGKAKRKDKVEVMRNGEVFHSTRIATLKRFKDDVREVGEGYECGLTLDRFDGLLPGDVIEVYYDEEIARTI